MLRSAVFIFILIAAGIFPAFGESSSPRALIRQYCFDCHDADAHKGGLNLEAIIDEEVPIYAESWETVVRRIRARQMPPPEKKRPSETDYKALLSHLGNSLDRSAAERPNPGRTDTFRRLNRTEYQNAIRDLLHLDIDAAALLPREDAGHGFDNVTVATLSPMLLDRYISAAQKISRLAVGASVRAEIAETIRIAADVTQEDHVEGLPLGTRGGVIINQTFPHDAEYEVQILLMRDRNEEIEGLYEPHRLELLVDREHVKSFTVTPPRDQNHSVVDQHLRARIPIKAGPHQIGVTFVKKFSSLLETRRQPYNAHFNMHRHPRQAPAIYQVAITGPYDSKGPGDTPSRRRIFVSKPANPEDEERCAEEILSTLMRRAYRRPVNDSDLKSVMRFYQEGKAEGEFETGIETALSAILISPNFLFRVEKDPAGVAPHTAYPISDLELATRLSFFLWSSIPDDELLETAIRGELRNPEILERQTRRMLADRRSRSLVSNFAAQWLHLRNLDSITPDMRLFPDFDDNLRQAFRRETELFLEKILREDRSILELLDADYTFLNERLARHYGVPHISGNRFRFVSSVREHQRGGLLRHGSILTVTSYANRTSPVIRGDWILKNIIGTPTPPPPPNVPTLEENTVLESLSVRERLALHRENPACAGCHNVMDPVGFSLENFDAVGRWRTLEEDRPVDCSGGLPDGNTFAGVDGLEEGLLKSPELFVGTMTEKLLTFALGRGVEYYDAPAAREILREAEKRDHRFSSIIVGIVQSTPFKMRNSL